MRVAVVGSRSCRAETAYALLKQYIPANCTEIVSGGAAGVDQLAERYARENGLMLRVFRPEYAKYGVRAPLLRNRSIVEYAQYVVAFWDGLSRGTAHTITVCVELGKKVRVVRLPK